MGEGGEGERDRRKRGREGGERGKEGETGEREGERGEREGERGEREGERGEVLADGSSWRHVFHSTYLHQSLHVSQQRGRHC